MRKYLLLVFLICGSLLHASAHGKTHKKKAVRKTVVSAKGISSVMMRRGACFGRCPEYSITINSNGMAEYNGYRNADPFGVYQKNIGTKAAEELLDECAKYRVDTCQAMYRSRIADVPGVNFTFTIEGKEKAILNAHFGPSFFNELSNSIDALGKPDNSWKKISGKGSE